ncbi:hypothetical protein GCM10007291_02130 [Gemmobacter nanjingensis]|uniref:DUF306 domain-containing protein n=1 Tax=Gemmobacter nanjingensis TaxID=488454 RepID=A0ABQ3F6P6_9RHOB|nr:META domain-containing protein [Gemmobacter nanjingensis]GHC09533.1 hypothetical protein GCM10007291_02130 [Gemmobacter nanjingensis]
MLKPLATLSLVFLAACQPGGEPSASQPVPTEAELARVWRLERLNGETFAERATLDLTDPARATGQAPCNRWFAAREGQLPAFRFGMFGATRMACPALEAESRYLGAMAEVDAASLRDGRLILTGPDGLKLEFLPQTP